MFPPRTRLTLQIALSSICLLWVFFSLRSIDWRMSLIYLGNLSMNKLAACFLMGALLYTTRLFRLHYWVETLSSEKLTTAEWIDLYLKSVALGSLTPARLGDFSRIALLARTGLSIAVRTKVTFQDKMADVLYIPIGLCLTSGIVGEKLSIPARWIFAGGIVSLIAYLLLSYWFGRFIGPKGLSVGWAVTIGGLCFFILTNTFLFWSAGIDLRIVEVAAITLSVGIIVSLPISVGGMGVREGSLICLLRLWGIQPEAIPPVLLLEFILNIVFPVVLFICWSVCMNIKKVIA